MQPQPLTVGTATALTPTERVRGRLPAYQTLEYAKTALELILLLLAVPFLIYELFAHPIQLSKRMAGHRALA
jgi:hypothetical protein